MLGEVLIGGMASLLICCFLGPQFIEYIRGREFGQQIREEGPAGHHGKAGTPTMGGLIIFLAVAVTFLILDAPFDTDDAGAAVAVLGVALASAGAGLRRRLDQGVEEALARPARPHEDRRPDRDVDRRSGTSRRSRSGCSSELRFRVFDASVDLGVLYPLLIFLVLGGATNGVNLTDGLDGLAAGCCAIVLLAYVAMTFITGQESLSLLSGCLVGACVGFLWFNSFPAAVFMGDTGSLGLGGAIAGLAVMTQTEVLLLIIGGIFVIEALSVAIQVFAFQRFRKRVFLMAPIHHHFELMAWSETKIILRFWIVAAVCSAIGFTLYQQSVA